MNELEIRTLTHSDAGELVEMFRSCRPDYLRFFQPFPFEHAPISAMLGAAVRDRFWGIRAGEELAGLIMMRGLDEGYATPTYGVAIAHRFAGRGLLKLSLQFAESWCRLNGIRRIMLKVHPDNTVAKRTYERHGFAFDRSDPASGQLVFYRDLR